MTPTIRTYPFKPGLLHQIEVIPIAATLVRHREMLTRPHRTDFYHIFWFREGSPTHLVDFEPIPLQPNSLLFVNKNRVHLFDPAGDYDGKCLIFTDQFFCQTDRDRQFLRSSILFNDLLDVPQLQLSTIAPLVAGFFQEIEGEIRHPADRVQPDILHNLLHNLLLHAEREKRRHGFVEIPKSIDLEYTLAFRDSLEACFHLLKPVSDYAAQLTISEKRLTQATAKVLGKTPKVLMDERVLLEAKRLLVHSHQSVKEIGFALGFDEPTNFIKYFRKHVGQPPGAFRDTYLG